MARIVKNQLNLLNKIMEKNPKFDALLSGVGNDVNIPMKMMNEKKKSLWYIFSFVLLCHHELCLSLYLHFLLVDFYI